ncbi:flagellar biosynthetic protein FliP [Roseateles depolymerans]|uniref:Flagellar biosynthetic protein FliP n=2 Tax=Roseateles depolymerans TaxID=76731 RepID=A0A0U3MHT7_9BURK|nr:Flagellar biosynthesis protein FliP [Roseateles depolymerans]REG21788.1 flagellar biosynthetic protein FliP [Roseateles depolymerans]
MAAGAALRNRMLAAPAGLRRACARTAGPMLGLATGLTLSLACHPAVATTIKIAGGNAAGGGGEFTLKTQVLVIMTLLGLLPVLVLMMTCFTRFVIVLSLLRQALGLQQGLPNRLVTGIALILTILVMRPIGVQVYDEALKPYDDEKITLSQALRVAEAPISRFMLAQTSKSALAQIAQLSGETAVTKPEDHSFPVKLAAFTLSELKTAFQIGCMLFIPFLVIDLVVSSVLMAMGMMMLSPLVISLPLKLLLFVLVDGWTLTVNTLVSSVRGVGG